MSDQECLFCKMVNGDVPVEIIYNDVNVIGFKDINPEAKIHHVFIHRTHSKDVIEMAKDSGRQLEHLFHAMTEYMVDNDMHADGARIVTNIGTNGGQSVFHTHFHLLGGERLGHFGH
ncbi:MAG: HIT domain-containing protein [Bdellovibrionales bacterium]|jgi:histidine triad (HIT) family protein|nr:HIT domain-containing protein [Bdellovibrionales bacterium]MBT3525832.1 HIT domain-containing protein [Bdellovibrionales bacterium]MBT7668315.1 HIT domain-containing protein [Bdellovibrionales bacterium]MBT7767930.1 HIT domain-containing protein [Bdellovibrionales bacterium]